ncbi:MAG: hypothetical protein OHM56_03050 [Spiroplasma phoeniceum]|nr:MAG: hypothetical protein OHM57_02500 [Spiroplasma phoeniceum]UZQ32943.1 MAG: hypothetical protein OHM56_03050 [Spiroplasma phoeniceum]
MKLKKVENFVNNMIIIILILLPWILIYSSIIIIFIFAKPNLTISYVLTFIGLFLGSISSIIVGWILLRKKTKNSKKTLVFSSREEKKND